MTPGNRGRQSRLESCKTKWFGQSDWAISKQTDEVMQKGSGLGKPEGGAFIPVSLIRSPKVNIQNKKHSKHGDTQ